MSHFTVEPCAPPFGLNGRWYTIKATPPVRWATGPGSTHGRYRRRRDAEARAVELNTAEARKAAEKELT